MEVVVQDRIIYMTCKNKHRSTTVLEEILLDLHLSMANPRISIFSKKVIRTNTENSVEVGLIVTSLIHSFSFVY